MSLQKKIRDLQANLENETKSTRHSYNNILERITNLEDKINTLSKPRRNKNSRQTRNLNQNQNQNQKNRQRHKLRDLSPSSNKHKKICVFDKCPPGAGEKSKLLYGQVKLPDGSTMCTFKTCPNGSSHVGDMTNLSGTDKRRLCVFNKCPTGSRPLASYINKKGTVKTKKVTITQEESVKS